MTPCASDFPGRSANRRRDRGAEAVRRLAAAAGCAAALLAADATARCHQCNPPATFECRIDSDPITVTGCDASARGEWGHSIVTRSCRASPPAHTLRIDHHKRRIAKRGHNAAGYGPVVVKSGYEFAYGGEVVAAYRTAAAVAQLKHKTALVQRIVTDFKTVLDDIDRAEQGPHVVEITVKAGGYGLPSDQHSSSITERLEFRVRCLAPVDLLEQVLDKYGLKADAASLPRQVTFRNEYPLPVVLWVSRHDIDLPCTDALRVYDDRVDLPENGGNVKLPIDLSMSACYSYGPGLASPRPVDLCEAFVSEDKVLTGASTDACMVAP